MRPSNCLPTFSIRNTGEPVLVRGTTVLVMPAYRHAAHRVFNAAEITYTPAARHDTGGQSAGQLPRRGQPPGVSADRWPRASRRPTPRSGGSSAILRKAFAYMENWPITVTQAPVGSEADFNNDIVLRFKASERGAAAVLTRAT